MALWKTMPVDPDFMFGCLQEIGWWKEGETPEWPEDLEGKVNILRGAIRRMMIGCEIDPVHFHNGQISLEVHIIPNAEGRKLPSSPSTEEVQEHVKAWLQRTLPMSGNADQSAFEKYIRFYINQMKLRVLPDGTLRMWMTTSGFFPGLSESSLKTTPSIAEHLGIERDKVSEGRQFQLRILGSDWSEHYQPTIDRVAHWFKTVSEEGVIAIYKGKKNEVNSGEFVEMDFVFPGTVQRDTFLDFVIQAEKLRTLSWRIEFP